MAFFSPHRRILIGSVAHPVSYPMVTGSCYHRIKRPRREADRSLPSSANVKNVSSWRGA
jgi:hypothetical protein